MFVYNFVHGVQVCDPSGWHVQIVVVSVVILECESDGQRHLRACSGGKEFTLRGLSLFERLRKLRSVGDVQTVVPVVLVLVLVRVGGCSVAHQFQMLCGCVLWSMNVLV